MDDSQLRQSIENAKGLLDGVIEGRLSARAAIEEWPDTTGNPVRELSHAWTSLMHFADDSHIHRADAEYAAARLQELREHRRSLEWIR